MNRTLRELLLGGPGLNGYAYSADTYCVECGKEIIKRIYDYDPDTVQDDSEWMPQPIFFGESSNCKIHCAKCGEYLYGTDSEES